MNQKQKASLPSVNRSVTQVEPPPFHEYFAENSTLPRQPHEFTAREFMEATGLSEGVAARVLAKDVKDGRVSVRGTSLRGGPKLYSVIK